MLPYGVLQSLRILVLDLTKQKNKELIIIFFIYCHIVSVEYDFTKRTTGITFNRNMGINKFNISIFGHFTAVIYDN